uniref:Uncharacterized protein n=1 Tax=Strombidium rassoulzadegani TaxID=1082188 RepID=A0A7S3CUK7_9SPIT|mmetsp:Transcript_9637/g.16185  ORF Transcript_9637/g.16185 Transcript_9637/m.16185 type:complete len:191 (+) Transcript_9637:375-947(+)
MVIYNIYYNVEVNDYWTYGNTWLVANTLYLIGQAIVGTLLAFEIPVFLLGFRVTRYYSFLMAIVYTVVFGIAGADWYYQLYLISQKNGYDFVTIFGNMVLAYNLIVHWSIIPVNLIIIIKELSMQQFTFLTGANYALNSKDTKYAREDLDWFLNPFTWIDLLWDAFFGYDVEDYWEENPSDEDHYYKNWS